MSLPRRRLSAGGRGWSWQLAVALLLTLLGLAGTARAATIVIDGANDPDSRLEIRTLLLPGGEEVQLYVLQGRGMRVTIDGDLLVADHVEFDLTNRIVRVIGEGSFTKGGETIEGRGLIIDISAEAFEGNDVLIVTEAIDVRGDSASRVPGLIRVALGEFSLCSRCAQQVEDYGFAADRLELYPGDRLVAYQVTVLVRERPFLYLPVLVLPLAPAERQPRLEYRRGSASEQALFAVTWPYVAGPDAFGNVGLRYYADVTPGAGSGFANTFLGGAVRYSYLGAALDHRFYTPRGKGELAVDFTPGFVTANGYQPRRFEVSFLYADEAVLGPPSLNISLTRDDARRPGIWEAALRAEEVQFGVRGVFTSQVYLNSQGGAFATPSYAARGVPLRTLVRLELEPEDLDRYTVGAFRLDRLLLDLGAFEDLSNPINRSAALARTAAAGRLVEAHTVTLRPATLWAGFSVEGRSAFTGNYYDTAERQVEWLNRLLARQSFGRNGSLALTVVHDVREGETPFRFDLIPYRNRTDLSARLQLTPLPWLAFEQRGGYVFIDDRNPGDVGWAPLASTLTLLGNLNWISLSIKNVYQLDGSDPGTLDATLVLRSRGRLQTELELRHVADLAILPDRVTQIPIDETASYLRTAVRLPNIVELSAQTAYRYSPPPPPAGQVPDHFDDLRITLTLGTLRHNDNIPGLAITYARDLDLGRTSAFAVEATARLGPLEVSAMQRLDLPSGRIGASRLRLALPGAVAAQADGLVWLPPALLGLPSDPSQARSLVFSLEQAPLSGQPSWQVRYSTVFDPALAGGEGAYRGSTLTGRALLDERDLGPARFSVDGFIEFLLRDERQPTNYLRRANLAFGVQLWERVGLQGSLGYAASYDLAAEQVSSGRLTLTEVAVVVRPLDELYLGAILNEVWDLTGNDPNNPPWTLRPTFTVVWNRCCWALYGSWNSATGALSITLTTPGADQGLSQLFQTGWIIPRREP